MINSTDTFWKQHLPQLVASQHSDTQASTTTAKPMACAIRQWGCISILGLDSQRFLQGQLTCDVEQMENLSVNFAGLCNPKGRLISNFFLIKVNNEDYRLLLHKSSIDNTISTLNKYAVFFKCKIADISKSTVLCGLLQAHTDTDRSPAPIKQENTAIRAILPLPANNMMTVYLVPIVAAADWLNALPSEINWQQQSQWEQALVEAGTGMVQAATHLEFIPQMLNMDLLDGISFTKGCYTGQEIIARIKYLGKQKRNMHRFSVSYNESTGNNQQNLVETGANISSKSGKNLGQIVTAFAASPTSWEVLAVIGQELGALHGEQYLLINGTEYQFVHQKLPYSLD